MRMPSGRTRVLLLVVLLPVLTLHAPGTVGPTAAQVAGPWEFGQYRQFTPRTAAAAPGVTTRAVGPLKLSRTAVQRPQVAPGEAADLIAEYEVSVPTGMMEVKETRIVRFEGQQVARLEKLVSLSSGTAGSKVPLKVPPDAAPGLYTVTTIIEPQPAIGTRSLSRAGAGDEARSMFRVATRAASGSSSAAVANDAPIRFRLWTERAQYKIGQTLKVFFQANRDGYVTLVNVGTSGHITILYPNAYTPNHAVKAGQTYSVPGADEQYALTLSGPEGVELVYALFTTVPARFIEANFTKDAFPPVNERAEALTRDINVTVKTVPLKEQANAALEIEVTR